MEWVDKVFYCDGDFKLTVKELGQSEFVHGLNLLKYELPFRRFTED